MKVLLIPTGLGFSPAKPTCSTLSAVMIPNSTFRVLPIFNPDLSCADSIRSQISYKFLRGTTAYESQSTPENYLKESFTTNVIGMPFFAPCETDNSLISKDQRQNRNAFALWYEGRWRTARSRKVPGRTT